MPIWGFISENWTVIGSTTVLSVLVTKLIDWRLKKNEINLAQENAKEIEGLKSELSHQNSRLLTAYSGVYKDQVEALKKLYNLILDFEAAIYSRRDLSNIDPDKYGIPGKILSDFKIEFYRNSIFIPESIDQKIIHILGFGFSHALFDKFKQAEQAAINGDINEANNLSKEGFKNDDELITLREDFKREIRKVLAVD